MSNKHILKTYHLWFCNTRINRSKTYINKTKKIVKNQKRKAKRVISNLLLKENLL